MDIRDRKIRNRKVQGVCNMRRFIINFSFSSVHQITISHLILEFLVFFIRFLFCVFCVSLILIEITFVDELVT